jgi:hypothetical protein
VEIAEPGRAGAVDALSWQIVWRCRQDRHSALEGEDCIFLTVHVQRLLRAIGARKTGEKGAAAAIATMQAKGRIVDTGETKHEPIVGWCSGRRDESRLQDLCKESASSSCGLGLRGMR